MNNRIGGGTTSQSTSTSGEHTSVQESTSADAPAQSGGADGAIGADQSSSLPDGYDTDSWEDASADGEDFGVFVGAGGDYQAAATGDDDSVSVMELQAQAAVAAPKSEPKSIEDNPIASDLADIIADDSTSLDDILYARDLGRSGGPIDRTVSNLSIGEREAMLELFEDPAELRSFLSEAIEAKTTDPDEIQEGVDAVMGHMKADITSKFQQRVGSRVSHITRKASEPYEAINASSDTRRNFLSQLAELEGDKGKLAERMEAFGIDADAAGDIAEVLADAHGDPEALAALRDGAEGPERAGIQVFEESKAYAFADEELKDALDDNLGALEALGDRAGNDQITGAMLTNDDFKVLRDQVLSEMGGDNEDALRSVIGESTAEVESSQSAENKVKIGISIATAVGVGVATGGLGLAGGAAVGVGTNAAASAPDLLVAMENLNMAELAAQKEIVMPDGSTVEMGMSDQASADKARHNRNVAGAKALAAVLLGGASPTIARDMSELGSTAFDGASAATLEGAAGAAEK